VAVCALILDALYLYCSTLAAMSWGIKSREKPHKGDNIFAFNAKVSCICVLKEFIGGKA
jgi:hypothetical protein